MQLVNKDTDYAVRALCLIARADGTVTVGALAEQLSLPRPFLRKVLQQLSREGFLRSYRGRGGGFVLARSAQTITLRDLVSALQEPLDLARCTVQHEVCTDIRTCLMRGRLKAIERFIDAELASMTIASLMAPNRDSPSVREDPCSN